MHSSTIWLYVPPIISPSIFGAKTGGRVPKLLLLDQMLLSIAVPQGIADADIARIRRRLLNKRFTRQLLATVRAVIHASSYLRKVHVSLSR